MVDTLGLLLTVMVTIASIQDRDGAPLLLNPLPGGCKKLLKIWVDGGYSGRLVEWVTERFKFFDGSVAVQGNQKVCIAAPPVGSSTHLCLAEPFTPAEYKLRAT